MSAEQTTGRVESAVGWTDELQAWLQEAAQASGFDVSGVAEVRAQTDPAAKEEARRFAAWVDAGRAGEMGYLKRRDEDGRLLRGGVEVAIPWAQSVVVCALNYNTAGPRSIDPASPREGWIGRYAWSGRRDADGTMKATDYHAELLRRLREVETGLHERRDCTTRCYVDTGPVLERSLAAQAGVGWIGKNTCVINEQQGSWLLLGVIVTSLRVEQESAPVTVPDRCGSCTRCIDACPTGALLGTAAVGSAREMDASRCIAYLTIEKKGAIDEPLRGAVGRQVFGCDICQDVCPWNRRAPVASHAGMEARPELINPALEWLAAIDAQEFRQRFKGSPLERTGRKRLLRNVAIAMGNSGQERFLPQLQRWAQEPASEQAHALSRADLALRESAEWARARILEVLGGSSAG